MTHDKVSDVSLDPAETKSRKPGRPRKPNAPTGAERAKAWRAARKLVTVHLPPETISCLDTLRLYKEGRMAALARIVKAVEAEQIAKLVIKDRGPAIF